MAFIIRRRESIILGAAAAAMAMGRAANAQSEIPKADVPAPKLPIEKGATLRLIRPARFVWRDAARGQVPRVRLHVKLQLVFEFPLEPAALQKSCQPAHHGLTSPESR